MAEADLAQMLLVAVGVHESGGILRDVSRKLVESKPGDERGFAFARLLLQLRKQVDCTTNQSAQIDQDQILRPVLDFVSKSIRSLRFDDVRLSSIVRFCCLDYKILDAIVCGCRLILFRSIKDDIYATRASFADTVENTTSKVANTAVISFAEPSEISNVAPETLNEAFQFLSVGDCLSFMKALLHQIARDYFEKVDVQWLILLVTIARTGSQEQSTRSKEAILAFLSRRSVQEAQDSTQPLLGGIDHVWSKFWRQVFDLTDANTFEAELYRVNVGLTIWLRLTSTSDATCLLSKTLRTQDYWQRIQSILANGSAEQRKIVLVILKRSIALCTQDLALPLVRFLQSDAKSYLSQYSRFATLFETVVIARYLNQVQDCLPTLAVLSSTASVVHPSWIVVLLHAGLSHGMQDSIRKVIGSWAIDHAAVIVAQTERTGANFLEQSFLPWATMGSHFSSSAPRDSTIQPTCPFGERLSGFLIDTILLANDKEGKLLILGAALGFLASKGGRMFSFARAFVLDGLVNGLRKSPDIALEASQIRSLNQIAQQQGFQEIVRDLMALQCYEIYEIAIPSHLRLEEDTSAIRGARKAMLDRMKRDPKTRTSGGQIRVLNSPVDDSGWADTFFATSHDENVHLICQLTSWIRRSNHRCLSANGLDAACHFLHDALECAADVEVMAKDLDYVLDAIMSEVQLRDHPRHIMMIMPSIIFHPSCVAISRNSPDFAKSLEQIGNSFWEMAKTRIYLFPPIAIALRRAFLVPGRERLSFTKFILDYANNSPSTSAEFQLEQVMSPKLDAYMSGRNYEYYYGKPEGFGHACVLDTLNRLPSGEPWDTTCRQILDQLICRWLNQKPPIPIFSHWKTTTQLQVMLMFLERLTSRLPRSNVDRYMTNLLTILSVEPLPRFRFLLEWTILRMHLHVPEKRLVVLAALSTVDVSNPKFAVSTIKIAFGVTSLPDVEESFGVQAMAELVSLSASQKIVIRHEAHWTVPMLWELAEKRGWKSITGNIAFARLNSHIRSLEAFKAPPLSRLLERFDPVEDHNLINLVRGNYLLMEPREILKVSLADLVAMSESESGQIYSTSEVIPFGSKNHVNISDTREDILENQVPGASQAVPAAMLQTKSLIWHDETSPSQDNPSTESYSDPRRRSNGVIVIASLIDNPYNLGGICRVSEIFGVEALQVRSLSVIKSRDFTAVSVSSHLWLPIEELGEDAISDFLARRKSEGYCVVGVEQTDASRTLGREECKLPWKMVLVLGSEKEGIPADLLAEMDLCVEVRQSGVTRSMNVQTALSVGLYEYQRQHQGRAVQRIDGERAESSPI